MTDLVLTTVLVLSGCLVSLWLLSLALKDSSVIDYFWGFGFIIIVLLGFGLGSGFIDRRSLITLLVVIWGVRLSTYLLRRNLGKGEDYRYQAFRAAAGANYWWTSFFKVFALQGLIMVAIATPLWAALTSPNPATLTVLDLAGVVLWCIGMIFETIGDAQLAAFRRDPANKGKVLRTGLWRYTRHPNYFGEAVLWWGYGLIGLAAAGGWWTIYAPAVMTLLLIKVSGVSLLEQSLIHRKPGYAEYVRSTNAFVPWRPRTATLHAMEGSPK